jgi:hypothetical protein
LSAVSGGFGGRAEFDVQALGLERIVFTHASLDRPPRKMFTQK